MGRDDGLLEQRTAPPPAAPVVKWDREAARRVGVLKSRKRKPPKARQPRRKPTKPDAAPVATNRLEATRKDAARMKREVKAWGAAERAEAERYRAEAEARLAGEAATQARFAEQAKMLARRAAAQARHVRRRRKRLEERHVAAERLELVRQREAEAIAAVEARRKAYDKVLWRSKLAHTRLQQAREYYKRNGGPKGSAAPRIAQPWQVLGRTQRGRVDPGLRNAKTILESARGMRRRQRYMGQPLVDFPRLRAMDARMEWLLNQHVATHKKLVNEAKALGRKALAGDQAARRQLERLLVSDRVKAFYAQQAVLFGKKPGEAGVVDDYAAERAGITRSFERYWEKRLAEYAPFVPNPPGPATSLRPILGPALVQRATDLQKEILGPMRLPLEDGRTDFIDHVKGVVEAEGLAWEEWRLDDPLYVQRVIAYTVSDWEERYWAEHGGRPDEGFDLIITKIRSAEDGARLDAMELERERYREYVYRLFEDRAPPGLIESVLEMALTSPAVMAPLTVLSMGQAGVGAAVRLPASPFGEVVAPQWHPEGFFRDVSPESLRAKMAEFGMEQGAIDAVVPEPEVGPVPKYALGGVAQFAIGAGADAVRWDRQGFFAWVGETPEGRKFYEWLLQTDPGALGAFQGATEARPWGDIKGLGVGIDVSPESRARSQREATEFFGALNTPAPGEGPIEAFWRKIDAIVAYGSEPFAKDAGNAGNLAAQLFLDPLVAMAPSRLPRIAQLAVKTAGQRGAKEGAGLFLRELARHRLGLSLPKRGGPDAVGAFVELRAASKVLKRDVLAFTDLSERDIEKIALAYARRADRDPTATGFMAMLERKFGRKIDSSDQVLATVERYLRKQLAEDGVAVISEVDEAVFRQQVEDIVRRALARDADRAADAVVEGADASARASLRKARDLRGKRMSVFEGGDDFVDRPGAFRAPSLRRGRRYEPSLQGAVAGRWYGRGSAVPPGPRVFASVEARHAEDVIAIADRLARERGLGVRWVRSEAALTGSGLPGVELFGGTAEEMARMADELEQLMRANRLGSVSPRYQGLSPFGDGRVHYRLVPGEADVFAKRLSDKRRLEAARVAIDKVAPRLQGLADEIERLKALAVGGDKAAQVRMAGALLRQKRLLKRVKQMQAIADAYDTGLRGGLRRRTVDAAAEEALRLSLGDDEGFIRRQLTLIADRLKAPGANRKVLLADQAFYEEALLGVDVVRGDLAGPMGVAKRVVARHGAEADSFMAPAAVAPLVPEGGVPGVTFEQGVRLESARPLRAMLSSAEVREADLVAREAFEAVSGPLFVAPARVSLPSFGVEMTGTFMEVWPVVRAVAQRVHDWTDVPELAAYIRSAYGDVAAAGVDAHRLLGVPANVPVDEVDVLGRVYDGGLEVVAERLGAFGWADYRALDAKVQAAVIEARQGYKVERYSAGGNLRHWVDEDPGASALYTLSDYDLPVLQAKAAVLAEAGMPVGLYDEMRSVAQGTLLRHDRALALADAARAAGGDFDAAFLEARSAYAQEIAQDRLLQWALRNGDGRSPSDVWDDYLRSLDAEQLGGGTPRELSAWQHRTGSRITGELAGVRNALDDAAWAKAMGPLAPSTESSALARRMLEERGFWTPKTADDIRQGRKVWSAEMERDYWQRNWGVMPKWVDVEYLRGIGAFDSIYSYAKAMTDLGVQDNTIDLSLRFSGLSADAQRLRVIWGDEAAGVKQLRSVEAKREWMAERWGAAVVDEDGAFIAAPWLMDPTGPEYRRWLESDVRVKIDTDLFAKEELDDLARVIAERGVFEFDKLRAAYESGGAVLEQALLERSIALADDLLANPRWRKLLSRKHLGRQPWLHSLISWWGHLQRVFVITDPAFPILNRLEVAPVIGPKRHLAMLALRPYAKSSQVPDWVRAMFPNIESTGLGSGTSFWNLQGGGSFARLEAAAERVLGPDFANLSVADKAVRAAQRAGKLARDADVSANALRSLRDAGLMASVPGEHVVKLEMFWRVYTDRIARFVTDGMDEVEADILARFIAQQQVSRLFPNLGDAGLFVRTLNELVPFLHYNFATATLYAREIMAHPWIIHKLWVAGNVLEDYNRREWERSHPGMPYPSGANARSLQFEVGGETFTIDLTTSSDVFRGYKALVMLTDGKERPFKDYITRFFRVPHPIQAQLYALLMDEPSWYTGQPVKPGDISFAAKTLEWWQESLADGSVSEADWVRIITRAALFSEARTVDPGAALSQMYYGLPEAVRASFLEAHPELRAYWQSLPTDPMRPHLESVGLVQKNWYKQATLAEAEQLDRERSGYARLRRDYDDRLEALLEAGGNPRDLEYKALREERFLALQEYRARSPMMLDYDAFYDGPEEWVRELDEDRRDFLWDRYDAMNNLEPSREDFKSEVAYQRARKAFYGTRAAFLEANPEMLTAVGREQTVLEAAIADTYDRLGETMGSIGDRNIAIARLEAKGKDRLAQALRGVNDLEWAGLERSQVVHIQHSAPDLRYFGPDATPQEVLEYQADRVDSTLAVVLPGFTDQRYRDATPEGRRQMLRDYWYGNAITKVFDLSKDGADFVKRLEGRPKLLEEYLTRHPEKRANWEDRSYYFSKLDSVMATIKRTGDWSHWWKLMDSDKRFRRYYQQTHPEQAGTFGSDMGHFRKLGGVVRKAEQTGDWSGFWKALEKDAGLREWWLSQEPGRRETWRAQARYLAVMEPITRKAVQTGDWSAWRKALRSDSRLRETYFATHPGARQDWMRDEAYMASMSRWVSLAKADKQDQASAYFRSLPKWMRERYLKNNPVGQKAVGSSEYGAAMGRWISLFDSKGAGAAMRYFDGLPAWIRERYFSTHPGQREKFAANTAYGQAMQGWIKFFEKDDYEGADKYFDHLPLWMRQRYFENNPDKQPGPNWTHHVPDFIKDQEQAKHLGRYWLLTAREKVAYLKAHPDFRRYLRERGSGEEVRRAQILAGLRGIEDPWLKRVYQERYPELFSDEAAAEARLERYRDWLKEHPGMRDEVQEAYDFLAETYLGSVKGYGKSPEPLTLERLTDEERIKRRIQLRRKGRDPWQAYPGVPRPVPGLNEVLTGAA